MPTYISIYLYFPLYMRIYEHPVHKEGVTVLSMHEEETATPSL